VSTTAKSAMGSLAGFLSLAIVLTSCAGAMARRVEAGGGGSAPGQTEPGSPGGPGLGGGTGNEPCGTPVASGAGPDGTVAFTPCRSTEGPLPRPQVVEPEPGMADVRPIRFEHAVVGDDDRTVSIDFWSGVAPCSVLDHVDVSHGNAAVTITLYEGHDPAAGQVACPAIAMQKRVVVTLDEPLDGRKIVDGAA
jgi:hypothetical protein